MPNILDPAEADQFFRERFRLRDRFEFTEP